MRFLFHLISQLLLKEKPFPVPTIILQITMLVSVKDRRFYTDGFTFWVRCGIMLYRGDLLNIWIVLLVTFFAGMGAGLGTGFAGMSAAAVISPMLITFLGIEPYTAVGIALASDVLASAVSAFTYGKNKNLDIKNGLLMMAMVPFL